MKLTKRNIGDPVTFHGYDGNDYPGIVTEWRRRIATISYRIRNGATVRAYLESPNLYRITPRSD